MSPASRPNLRKALVCTLGVAVLLAAPAAAAPVPDSAAERAGDGPLAPIVITNDDLPDTLSVSVLGPLVVEETGSGLPDMAEIEKLAALNEAARREAEQRRPQPEPRVREDLVWREWYPYALFNTRCGFGLHCSKYPYPWGRARPRGVDASPHNRPALPPPREGYVGRPGPHLERVGPPRESIRGRPIRSHAPPRSRSRVHGAGRGSRR